MSILNRKKAKTAKQFFDIESLHSRIIMVIFGIIICNLILIVRVFEINLFNADLVTNITAYEHEHDIKRAEIVDRNGQVIATNIKTASLYANPTLIRNPQGVAEELHKIFPDQSVESLHKKLASENKFQWIARHINPKKQHLINTLGVIGLVMIDDVKRLYPHQHALSHIVGNVDVDNNGISGLEKEYDDFLKIAASENKKLRLTIDLNIQEIVRKVLADHIKKQDALGGSVMIMDPYSGELLAMVSMPDYDLNKIAKASEEARFNRNTLGLYEPGSTMKAITVAMAIDSKKVGVNGVFNVSNPIQFGKFKIKDFRGKGGNLSVPEILMYSSNIGTVKISEKVGKAVQKNYLRDFGFFSKMNIELSEVATPLYPRDKIWKDITASTVSFGHGIAVSPLHVISAYTPLINGGYYVHPILVDHLQRSKPKQVIATTTSDTIRKILRKVVSSGAGSRAELKGYFIGGKTGSAEKNKNGRYIKNANVSSFCGAFPMHDPKYLVYVMLDEAKKNDYNKGFTTAGMIAAPLARDIVRHIVGALGIESYDDQVEQIEEELNLEFSPQYQRVALGQ